MSICSELRLTIATGRIRVIFMKTTTRTNYAEMSLNEIVATQTLARYNRYMSEDFRAADDRIAKELQAEYETAAARAGWRID